MHATTIREPFTLEGTSIHTGAPSSVTFSPSNDGITWRAAGYELGKPAFKASNNTTIASFSNGVSLSCVEHVMAAIALAGITDMTIDVNGARELPFLDGSAVLYYDSFVDRVLHIQTRSPPSSLLINPFISISDDGSSWMTGVPYSSTALSIYTDFPDPLGSGICSLGDLPIRQLASARSFIRDPINEISLNEATSRLPGLECALKQNALILWSSATIESPLRFDLEWRYHKLLDLIGDLRCAGPLPNTVLFASRPGHKANAGFRDALSTKIVRESP